MPIRLLLLCLLPVLLRAQSRPDSTATDRLVGHLLDSTRVTGLSLAVIRQNRVADVRGYGRRNADSSGRVDAATVFDAASLSKPVFSYAVLQLVDAGLLDLDKPLYTYLPYPDAAADARYKQITARLVLSHASGLPNWRRNRRLPRVDLVFTPGDRFGYSGEGFVYLQRVVEKLTGRPIDQLITERVFRPLGMTRSSYTWQPAFATNYACPHDSAGVPQPRFFYTQPNMAYSLLTTADDYARFVVALSTGRGLTEATARQWLSPQRQLPTQFGRLEPLSPALFWGLGIGLEQTPAGPYAWHWGDNDTFKAYVTVNLTTGDGLVFFANHTNGLALAAPLLHRFVPGVHPALGFLDLLP